MVNGVTSIYKVNLCYKIDCRLLNLAEDVGFEPTAHFTCGQLATDCFRPLSQSSSAPHRI